MAEGVVVPADAFYLWNLCRDLPIMVDAGLINQKQADRLAKDLAPLFKTAIGLK